MKKTKADNETPADFEEDEESPRLTARTLAAKKTPHNDAAFLMWNGRFFRVQREEHAVQGRKIREWNEVMSTGVGHCARRVNVRVEKNTDGQMATGQMAKGQDDQRKPCSGRRGWQLEEAVRAQH